MVAVVSSLVFVVAVVAALGVIAAMIADQRARILGLLDGSMREVALPHAIRVKAPRVRRPRSHPAVAPRLVALRAAA